MTKGAFFRKASLDVVEEEIADAAKKYIDFSTKQVRAELVRERVCEVCGSKNSRTLFYKYHFPHVQCTDCNFVYVNPILKNEILNEHYTETSNAWTDITIENEFDKYQIKYHEFHLDNIEKVIGNENRSILDIGCNAGEFLCFARNRGWDVTGLELNIHAMEKAREKGIHVVDKEFTPELFDGKKFGAITFFGVLEHLPEPFKFLKSLRVICEPGSVIAALVPNIDSLVARILHEKSNTFDGIEHLNFWNRQTFSRFLLRAGFEVIHSETTISELYTINNHMHYEDPYACPEEYPILLDMVTPEYIHKHFLGHHLCSYSRFLPSIS